MKTLEFIIEKEAWEVRVFPQEEYNTFIGIDSEAQVDINMKQMAFCQERITTEVLEHEMTHIYFDKCCLRSVNDFTVEQVEEIIAEFVPKYCRKIINLSKKLRKAIDKKVLED